MYLLIGDRLPPAFDLRELAVGGRDLIGTEGGGDDDDDDDDDDDL
jgi:hypothetical protein